MTKATDVTIHLPSKPLMAWLEGMQF